MLLFQNNIHSQSNINNCNQAELLVKAFSKYHYSAIELNDHLSGIIFNRFINLLDPYGLYFTNEDIQNLSQYRYNLKETIRNRSCNFLKQVAKLYEKRLVNADTLISIILQKPIDFSLKDTFILSNEDKSTYHVNNKNLDKRWGKWLKYQILLQLFTPANEGDDPFAKESSQILSTEQETVKKVKLKEKSKINHLLRYHKGLDNYVSTMFYDAIALSYDPHSTYFTLNEKQKFLTSLSKETYSFGIGLEENLNGEVIISRLTPGGPAWKSGKLNKGDILRLLKWESQKPVNLTNLNIEEVGEILKFSNSGSLEFTVKKTNGQLTSVKLIKEKIQVEENVITSHILKGEKKIGYISLPDFYTEVENQNALGCANDVAKEIIKLKKENIDGLILDLRFNGGGSVAEAMDLAGIFIDEGPLGIVRYRNSKPMVLKDMNRGTIYNGPLVIMVNGQSASASEILAAVLQDYHRAVIIGNSTYGKATGQNIFPLDTAQSGDFAIHQKNKFESGYAKITVCKFYRITGVSYQLNGITPDIILPNMLNGIEYREKLNPAALGSDSVTKKLNCKLLPELPVKELSQKSKTRISLNDRFQQILSLNKSISSTIKQDRIINLQIDTFKKEEKEISVYFHSMDSLPNLNTNIYSVENNNYNEQIINVDTERKEYDELLIKNIQEDIYIEEGFKIISDLIKLTKLNK